MQKLNNYFLLFFIFLITACKSPIQKTIKDYELNNHKRVISSIDVLEQYSKFIVSDSIHILQKELSTLKANRIQQLNSNIEALDSIITIKQSEYYTIESETLKKIYKNRLENMVDRKHQFEQLITLYKDPTKGTQLKVIIDEINAYKKDSTLLIGYIISARFTGQQGTLASEHLTKQYLFDVKRQSIIGEIHQ